MSVVFSILSDQIYLGTPLKTSDDTKKENFSEKSQARGVIFNLKIYVADFGPLKRAF